ncbi:WAT1-related protein At1g68170-like [Gossypium arboreum]|uniref:WAT1-related protein At1g68170-like n=1 Tax=Gossypium arboreum TaxID=29729 RepID=UPI0008196A32|nr:WAT1-related protein At1g68170-like [Gossypium arboreum]XP_017615121.1 WAT1-related protein At1g68170-like [Gossypium arboreum]XP_052882557.1 WAT1-related protein At1g68170-like [Gossypium arboreum]
MCLMGSIQGALYAVCTVRDWNQWKLGWNVRLLAVAFVGIMGSALFVFLVSWAVRLKGPLYAAIFNPLGLVLLAIVGSLLLDEKLHLGRMEKLAIRTNAGKAKVCGTLIGIGGATVFTFYKGEEQEREGTETPFIHVHVVFPSCT